ncbi:hypothetical protein ACOMHN_009792 [Nucella lapillus]
MSLYNYTAVQNAAAIGQTSNYYGAIGNNMVYPPNCMGWTNVYGAASWINAPGFVGGPFSVTARTDQVQTVEVANAYRRDVYQGYHMHSARFLF